MSQLFFRRAAFAFSLLAVFALSGCAKQETTFPEKPTPKPAKGSIPIQGADPNNSTPATSTPSDGSTATGGLTAPPPPDGP